MEVDSPSSVMEVEVHCNNMRRVWSLPRAMLCCQVVAALRDPNSTQAGDGCLSCHATFAHGHIPGACDLDLRRVAQRDKCEKAGRHRFSESPRLQI